MNGSTLFDPPPPTPDARNDAIPAATGDGDKGQDSHDKPTKHRQRRRVQGTLPEAYRDLGLECRSWAAKILEPLIGGGA